MISEHYKKVLIIGINGGLAQITAKLLSSQYPQLTILGVDNRSVDNISPINNVEFKQIRYTRNEFERLFRNWIGGIAKKADSQVIAIDGKSSRHSFDGDDKKMLHVISAFATDVRIVLGQEKVSEKSNEITAIPKMLEWLDVKGHIVTIDAMGCQYGIANRIRDKQGDYIFSLKGNQGTLLD